MSERMSNERAIEILTDLYNHELIIFKNNADEPSESEYTNIDVKQALKIAIYSLDENERLKKERDYILEKAKAELKDNEWVDVENGLPKVKGYFNLSDTVICEDSGGGLYLGFYDYSENKFISCEDSVSWLIDIVAWKYIKPRKE